MSTIEAADATPGTASETAAVSPARGRARFIVVLLGEVTDRPNPPGGLGERASPTPEVHPGWTGPRARRRPPRSAELAEERARVALTLLNETKSGTDLALRESVASSAAGDFALAEPAGATALARRDHVQRPPSFLEPRRSAPSSDADRDTGAASRTSARGRRRRAGALNAAWPAARGHRRAANRHVGSKRRGVGGVGVRARRGLGLAAPPRPPAARAPRRGRSGCRGRS